MKVWCSLYGDPVTRLGEHQELVAVGRAESGVSWGEDSS